MSDQCQATTKPQWYGPAHPCKQPAWKDGFCRVHHPDNQPAGAAHAGCPSCTALRARNAALRAKVSAQRKAMKAAQRLLLKSAEPFDQACVIIREAVNK